jgi:hypothetical protein
MNPLVWDPNNGTFENGTFVKACNSRWVLNTDRTREIQSRDRIEMLLRVDKTRPRGAHGNTCAHRIALTLPSFVCILSFCL